MILVTTVGDSLSFCLLFDGFIHVYDVPLHFHMTLCEGKLCAEGPGLRMETAGLQSMLNAFFPLVSETHGFLKDMPLL